MLLPDLNLFIQEKITERTESLCQRDLDKHSFPLYEAIRGKTVLVIGGGGTIGSNFIRCMLPYQPGRLVVVDSSENALTELTRDLRSSSQHLMPDSYTTYPMDYGDPVFYKMLTQKGPFNIVANFAAHKHVRSEKDVFSIEAMIRNNVVKTYRLLSVLSETGPPEHFFCVSTDKAAEPVNVMGASKQLMENVIRSFSPYLKVSTARFANVAFSNGSLLDGYLQRLRKRQPLSCPSDVQRYFVSPMESGQICLLACIIGKSGDIFFPKLHKESLKYFKQITTDFLAFLDLEEVSCTSEEEARDYPIHFEGSNTKYPVYYFKTNTSGEKLFEVFYNADDLVDFDRMSSLGIISQSSHPSKEILERKIERLIELFDQGDICKIDVVKQIELLVPGFEHLETGKSLDQQM
ncbi:MAG: polysaccharide biosynthesis protein [Saprospiraceae bacterium]|nr:polysaccharide biosynthesis protein [Saprospiraceae bacterium]